jgi:mono/diheme cytochrome c family protein
VRHPWPRRSGAAVGLTLAIVGIAVLLEAACSGGAESVPSSPESIAIGAAFFESNCQVCHGADGKGSPQASDLTIHVPTRDEDFLFGRISKGFVSQGVRTMPAWEDELSVTERWHLVNFIIDSWGELTFVTPSGP